MVTKLLRKFICNWNIQIIGYVQSFGIFGQVAGDFGGYFLVLIIPICPHNCTMEMNVKYLSAIIFPLPDPSFLL